MHRQFFVIDKAESLEGSSMYVVEGKLVCSVSVQDSAFHLTTFQPPTLGIDTPQSTCHNRYNTSHLSS
jgi:hypothetical protein